jgi:Sulfotransferase domain
MEKIIGIGWAKTGTTSLGEALRILGYDHQTQRLDLVADLARGDLSRILAIAAEKDSFDDWPWLLLFRELDGAFPGSKFILTVRDPEPWLASYVNMLKNEGPASEELNRIRSTLYGLPFPDVTPEQLVARYDAHNRAVIEHFRDRPESLLIVNWAEGDGWEQLCAFCGKSVPEVPFPRANRGRYGSLAGVGRQLKSWLR